MVILSDGFKDSPALTTLPSNGSVKLTIVLSVILLEIAYGLLFSVETSELG